MKKLLDSKFLFIVALSLVMLIILGIGAYYLFDNNDATFVKSGYVLNPMSAKSEKYFFDANTGYREDLSSMIVFKDVDNNKASILKDSFLHYNDGSISFLSNGAILDLDSISKNSEAVNFYNITNKSILTSEGKGYYVKTAAGDVAFVNFIGRINDDKYIVAGDLEAKIPGNEKNIKGDYFEIVYSEEGIVNIENKDVKFQVTAQGTVIYADTIAIDLGTKRISKNGENIMSMTAITINGDENIEIIPNEEEAEPSSSSSDNGDGNGTGTTEDGNGNGNGEGGTGNANIDVEREEGIIISLKDASVGSTNVNVTFDIFNKKDDDRFTLKVTNLETGRTADVVESVLSDEEIRVNLLSPNTKYLFTVVNETDGNKYFQKIFETKDFGIKLEKSYTTDSEIGYKVTIDKGTDITNAKLSLYKYNEVTKKNEIVTTTYKQSDSDEEKSVDKVVELSSLNGNIEGAHEIVFDGLDSNTIYTAVLDEFSIVSSNFKDIYNISLTSMTLKQTPTFNDMVVNKDVGSGTFKLSLENISDPDNAILTYKYLIYEANNPNTVVIPEITNTSAAPIEVKVGNGEGQLKSDTNYFYKVVIEYYDNEKYIEYITKDKITFVMGSDPHIIVVPNEELISYDRIGATISLVDNSCLVPMPGRENCNFETDNAVVEVYKINSVLGGDNENKKTLVYSELATFEITDDDIKYDLFVDKLQAGQTYEIVVRAFRTDMPGENRMVIEHYEGRSQKTITTKSLASFVNEWKDQTSNANHVINLKTKFIPKPGVGTMTAEETINSISRVVVKVYEGNYEENIQSVQPLAVAEYKNTDEFSIKENFYDNGYIITSDGDFGLTLEGLKADGKLNECYTVAIYAYYDESDSSEITIDGNIIAYKISPILLLEDIVEPKILVDPINKVDSDIETNLNNDSTVVGYSVKATFDKDGLVANGMIPKEINFYVYTANGHRIDFYVKDNNGKLHQVSRINEILGDEGYKNTEIYMADGSEYQNPDDDVMHRGNKYFIGYEVIIDSSGTRLSYPSSANVEDISDPGFYQYVEPFKEVPTVKMYIAKSTNDTITYRYDIKDPDNSLYRESLNGDYGMYYKINDGSEHKINITKVDGDYVMFAGDITLVNLKNGDEYALYHKDNIFKSGDFEKDVLNYFGDADDGKRVFDGYYDLKDERYAITYKVINNPLVDNRVYVRLFGDEKILDRVISYQITFNDTAGHDAIVVEKWQLESCPNESTNTRRCFSVDYSDLKTMKSSVDNDNTITVSVKAIYDNGLSGYDFTVGDDKEYKYMILQNDLIPDKAVTYVSLSEAGEPDYWTEGFGISKGYYTYSMLNDRISYRRRDKNENSKPLRFELGTAGYVTNKGVVTPKMISIDTISGSDNTFLFYSYTPKVKIVKTTNLINGAVIDLNLVSADASDFCEEGNGHTCVNNSHSDFYLYIEVWDTLDDVGDLSKTVLPTSKVKINRNDVSSVLQAVVKNLTHGTKYYYQVYADLNKNGQKERTQLFDAGNKTEYKTEIYDFTTLASGSIYHDFNVRYLPDTSGEYNDKLMTTNFTLIAYKNNIAFNFDLAYAFCELNDETCGIQDGDTNIFKRTILEDNMSTNVSDTVNITDKNLEYDKNYTLLAYIIYDHYNKENGEIEKNYLLVNRIDSTVNLKKLETPSFVVNRKAMYADGDYFIEFNINVNDPDRVITDGKYYVKLVHEGETVGDLQVKVNGNYTTVGTNGNYADYAFRAADTNKTIRIKGLEKDTKYTIYVNGVAYMNNSKLEEEEKEYHAETYHLVFSTNDYGVAIGNELLPAATANSIIITFLGGSNFDNISEVSYTRGLWENETSSSTISGSYTIGTDKRFEPAKDTGNWQFVIDPPGLVNEIDQPYKLVLLFEITDPDTGDVVDNIRVSTQVIYSIK